MPRTPPTVISLPAAADHVGGPWDGAQAIVLHHTGGRDSRAWLTRTSRPPVSVHTLIPKDGTVVRIVPDGVNAWHVGGSRLGVHGPNERAGSCNEICFGIEIENLGDGKDPYTDEQYWSVGWQVADWWNKAGRALPVITHALIDLAGKRDPYACDLARVLRCVLAWYDG